ncbi:MAG: DUF4136 domain-containing protein [Gammaproteobacteria bacterium]|nr:DUF4136 domain-containing protein [Gammaproteobacteria bacterium]
MQKIIIRFAAVVATALLGGCATGFEATYDHDPANDFAAYKTFAWISEHPMKVGSVERIPSPLLESQIMVTIESALGAKGYKIVPDAESADFALSFTVGSRDEIKVDSYPSMSAGYAGYGYPRGWGGWGGSYYGYGTETTVRQYTEGMLAIDVFDVEGRRPVWHGVASKTISDSDRKDSGATIQAAVDAILVGFPPQ